MNIERTDLMYFVALPEVFADYNVHKQGTKLQSGKMILHASHCGNMAVRYSGDSRVVGLDEVGMRDYLTYVDDYEGATGEEV